MCIQAHEEAAWSAQAFLNRYTVNVRADGAQDNVKGLIRHFKAVHDGIYGNSATGAGVLLCRVILGLLAVECGGGFREPEDSIGFARHMQPSVTRLFSGPFDTANQANDAGEKH